MSDPHQPASDVARNVLEQIRSLRLDATHTPDGLESTVSGQTLGVLEAGLEDVLAALVAMETAGFWRDSSEGRALVMIEADAARVFGELSSAMTANPSEETLAELKGYASGLLAARGHLLRFRS